MSNDISVSNDTKCRINMKTVFRDLLFTDLECKSDFEVIDFLSSKLLESGKVKEDFAKEVKKRETIAPTGLPTVPYGVAIPHTEQDHVNETCLAFARMKKEIVFKSILNDGSDVNVKFVFLLASRDSKGHMQFMKNIMTAFQSEEIQHRLMDAKDPDELYEILKFIDEND